MLSTTVSSTARRTWFMMLSTMAFSTATWSMMLSTMSFCTVETAWSMMLRTAAFSTVGPRYPSQQWSLVNDAEHHGILHRNLVYDAEHHGILHSIGNRMLSTGILHRNGWVLICWPLSLVYDAEHHGILHSIGMLSTTAFSTVEWFRMLSTTAFSTGTPRHSPQRERQRNSNISICTTTLLNKFPRSVVQSFHTNSGFATLMAAICICAEQTFSQANAIPQAFSASFSTALKAYLKSTLWTEVNSTIAGLHPEDYEGAENSGAGGSVPRVIPKLVEIIKTHPLRM
ncbi:hypothetical protein C8R45DRAFT_945571 [Mycena sanguinolenta]|nr:hypothetical protein C8R45DRAFT_945571 [Mycena sanguinolenta]